MSYIHYERHIIDEYHVVLDGWPIGLPFTSPSKINSLKALQKLVTALEGQKDAEPTCAFRALSTEEYSTHVAARAAKEAAGDIEEHVRKERSDKGFTRGPYKRSNNVIDTGDSGASMEAATGGKRKRGKENGPVQKKRKVKSSRIIQSDIESA